MDDKWASCQWCHYWPLFKRLGEKTKKCPNCGQGTEADDKWASCQWCHWPLSVKHPPDMEERRFTLGPSTWKWGVFSVVVVTTIFYGLVLLQHSGWNLSAFQQLILGEWRSLLLWLLICLGIALFSLYLIYLVTRVVSRRPELLFGALVAVGILLLLVAQKGNPSSQYLYDWIVGMWHIDMLSASITVLSLALTFGAILITVGRTKK